LATALTVGIGFVLTKALLEDPIYGKGKGGLQEVYDLWAAGDETAALDAYFKSNYYLKLGRDSRLKLPLVWLVESVTEEEYGVRSNLERKSSIRVLFLDNNNPKQYQTNDYRLNVVSPMIGLKDAFIKAVLGNTLFNDLESWNTRPFTRLGVESDKGFEANILDENLSGVELSITLPIRKTNCKC
jgi:hypothetical protein